VRTVSEVRGSAPIAAKLYEETEEGRKAREALQVQMKAAQSESGYQPGRPTKKDRRDIERMRRKGF
jgi:ribosome-associated heat shock protein Hsp15